jgi:hypothetical protein
VERWKLRYFNSFEFFDHTGYRIGVKTCTAFRAKLTSLKHAGFWPWSIQRFMVRGPWRPVARGWRDQRVRWINSYRKGPDMAAVVERAYRLKP